MGYPDYNDIINERERRRKQEMEGGRQRTLKVMAEALLERLKSDHKIKHDIKLDASNDDPREWTVTIDFEVVTIVEKFMDFPSPEFLAKKMLLTK